MEELLQEIHRNHDNLLIIKPPENLILHLGEVSIVGKHTQATAVIVIEEMGLLWCGDRGLALQQSLCRLRLTNPTARIIGLSLCSQTQVMAEWLQIKAILSFAPPYTIQREHVVNQKGNLFRFEVGLTSRLNPWLSDACLIFCSTRRSCEQTAEYLAKTDYGVKTIKGVHLATEDAKLSRLMQSGVGYLHAGITLSDRRLIEEAFKEGQLQCICTTTTAIMTKAKTVIVKGLHRYGPAGYEPYSDYELALMMSKATVNAVLLGDLTTEPLRFTASLEQIQEAMREEINLGLISSKEEAQRWLSYWPPSGHDIEQVMRGISLNQSSSAMGLGVQDTLTWLCKLQEMSKFRLKHGDKKWLSQVKDAVRYPLRQSIQEPWHMAFVGIQAYLEAKCTASYKFKRDCEQLCRTAASVLRSKLNQNHEHLLSGLELLGCLRAGCWHDQARALTQIAGIGDAFAASLFSHGVTVANLVQTDPRRLETLCGRHAPFGNNLHRACQQYHSGLELSLDLPAKRVRVTGLQVRGKPHLVVMSTRDGSIVEHRLIREIPMSMAISKGDQILLLYEEVAGFNQQLCVDSADQLSLKRAKTLPLEIPSLDAKTLPLEIPPMKVSTRERLEQVVPQGNRQQKAQACSHRCVDKEKCKHACCKSACLVSTEQVQAWLKRTAMAPLNVKALKRSFFRTFY